MTIDAYITIAILALTFGLVIRTKLPPALIFLGALTLTITFRLAPLKESLKGFSNPGVLTIGAFFMVAAGMYSTGAIGMITDKLIGRPKTLFGAQLRILPMGYAANLMVYEPGGYKFTDYAKVGIPLSILVGIVTVMLAPVFFKF